MLESRVRVNTGRAQAEQPGDATATSTIGTSRYEQTTCDFWCATAFRQHLVVVDQPSASFWLPDACVLDYTA